MAEQQPPSNLLNHPLHRKPRLRQLGIKVIRAAITHRGNHHAGQPLFAQAEFFVEDARVEAFDGGGVDLQRGGAQQQGAEDEVHLFFHPLLRVFEIVAVQAGVETEAFALRGFALRGGITPVGLFLREQAGEVGFI